MTAGIRSRELCQAPISASVILSLAGVVGEISFSNLQMQRWLRPDSNLGLEATYRHTHFDPVVFPIAPPGPTFFHVVNPLSSYYNK